METKMMDEKLLLHWNLELVLQDYIIVCIDVPIESNTTYIFMETATCVNA
jgi:hypothetical protein